MTVGYYPHGVGVNPTTNRIYIANWGSDTVSVIDGASNTVSATVTVGSWPDGVGVNPTTNRIYVANSISDTVSVIDGASDTVSATVTVGYHPNGVGVNPTTNRIYVTNAGSNTVSVIRDPADADLRLSMDYTLLSLSDITFAVVVSNSGPDDANGAVVSNTISANLTGTTGNCVVAGGATCSADGSGSMTVITFPAGSVVTYTLHGTLATPGYFENTASVSPPIGFTDPDMSNNSATIRRYRQFLVTIFKNYFAP